MKSNTKCITDPSEIAAVHSGEARIDGKFVLPTENIKHAAKRIYFSLATNSDLRIVAGIGLAKRSDSGQWYRRLTVPELQALVLEHFVLVREKVGPGGVVRLEILDGMPNAFWLPSLMQHRWIDAEVESWFKPVIKQEKVRIVTNP
jgi:hypothetical protein